MPRLLVITVGGSPEPVKISIDHHRPDYVVYCVSKESRKMVKQEIEPALSHCPEDSEVVYTPDAQNLVETFKALLTEVPKILEMWGIDEKEIICDYTGGTKTMSAALALALFGGKSRFSYIGGEVRNKGGLGIVERGHEQPFSQENPWDVLAIDDLREIETLFNMYQFYDAARRAKDAEARLQQKKPFFAALAVAAEGFQKWDDFRHSEALKQLRQAESKFRDLASIAEHESIPAFQQSLALALQELQTINQELQLLNTSAEPQKAHFTEPLRLPLDLIANAKRRAKQERYDDAVARLYGAVEKIAKLRLWLVYRLDNANVRPEQIPDEALRKRLCQENGEQDGRLKLPLFKSYELLQSLQDEVGLRFGERQDELKKLLDIRNKSILAHGFHPVSRKTYEQMLDITQDFLGVGDEALPRFPEMRWQGLGYDVWWSR